MTTVSTNLLLGEGSPEGVVDGNADVGYLDKLTGAVYSFGGTDGTNTGWITNSATVPVNWCKFSFTAVSPLAPGVQYTYQQADLAILAQSGSDFSIGADAQDGSGAILSTAGGQFLGAIYLGPGTMSLDGSSDALRWMVFACQTGPSDPLDPNNPATSLGMDCMVPLIPAAASGSGFAAVTPTTTICYVPAGASILYHLVAHLIAGVGTDSVTLDNIGPGLIWQVG